MRDVAIIDAGMTKFGNSRGDLMDLLAGASLRVIKHAGVDNKNFDSVYVGNMTASEPVHRKAVASALVDRISLVPTAAERVENGPASGESTVKNAYFCIPSGVNDIVLVAACLLN